MGLHSNDIVKVTSARRSNFRFYPLPGDCLLVQEVTERTVYVQHNSSVHPWVIDRVSTGGNVYYLRDNLDNRITVRRVGRRAW